MRKIHLTKREAKIIAKDTPAPKRMVEQLRTVGLVVKTTERPRKDWMTI
jgi:hypothetical protein